MKSEKGLHLRLIKGFKFPEPVFYSEKIKRNFRFLADPVKIKKKIDAMGKSEWEIIQNYGGLKPIRNPRIKYDQFWMPFQYSLSKSKESGFRMYPFQVVPLPSQKIKTYVSKTQFEGKFNINFQSIDSQYQIRLYPSGVGTVHLIIYLKLPPGFNLEKILNIALNRRWVNSTFLVINNESVNFSGWAERMYGGVLSQISDYQEEDREIQGYSCVINPQGNLRTPETRKILENFLERKEKNPIFLEKDADDIIYLNKNLLFLYVDTALPKFRHWKYLKPDSLLHGRRCFRNHLLNIIELGHCSAYLLTFYNNVANGLFGKPQDSKWIPTLEKIAKIPFYLEKEQWKKVYANTLYAQGIDRDFIDNTLQNSLRKKEPAVSPSERSRIEKILPYLATLSQLLLKAAEFFG